mgnify:CR=1 FL=1|tara:strand:+ start:108 stop:782 length:675 start_codon:yes stop_codon:yes gene_type:complete
MNPLKHVAIIMDGNGRWGKKYKNSRNTGHRAGLVAAEKIIKESIKQNIKFLTLYTFSTENWKRPNKEIKYLFNLLERYLIKNLSLLNKNQIRLKIIGEKKFPKKLNRLLAMSERKTNKNTRLQINLALNYGSKNEIVNSVKKLVKLKKKINIKSITDHLYTKNIPDPDILVRTGDTKRLSNFLLWQISYTEIFFTKKLWPEFTENDFKIIIKKFKKIKRNFGSI